MNVGIDLGTSYSLIGKMGSNGRPLLMPDYANHDEFHTPSLVYISKDNAFVGHAVERLLRQRPELNAQVIRMFKRRLGEREPVWKDSLGNGWAPEAIAALVLKKLALDAESVDKIEGAVVTVPASFNDLQRLAVRHAAMLADIPLLGLLEEPVAAALHYGLAKTREYGRLFVYDFGGGTFDCTVIEEDHVTATGGALELGGKEVDDRITESIMAQYEKICGTRVASLERVIFDARRTAEEIKIELSIPGRTAVRRNILLGEEFFEYTLDRRQFTELTTSLIERTIQECARCLTAASLEAADIQTVLLVGGSSMLPGVETRLRSLFPAAGKILRNDPSRAVALGAAINAAQRTGASLPVDLPPLMRGVTTYSLGIRTIEVQSGRLGVDTLIKQNSPLPVMRRKRYFTARPDQDRVRFEVLQFRPGEVPMPLGTVVIGPLETPRINYPIELCVECREDGTVSVEAFDVETKRSLKSIFSRDDEIAIARLAAQRELVRSMIMGSA